jgi:LPXTG-motif cell wall-anchored protein
MLERMMTTVFVSAALAETGSDVAPWLIGAGVVIVLGAIALIAGRIVRSRRAVAPVDPTSAAAAEASDAADAADAGSTGGARGPISPDDPR